VKTDLILHKEK